MAAKKIEFETDSGGKVYVRNLNTVVLHGCNDDMVVAVDDASHDGASSKLVELDIAGTSEHIDVYCKNRKVARQLCTTVQHFADN